MIKKGGMPFLFSDRFLSSLLKPDLENEIKLYSLILLTNTCKLEPATEIKKLLYSIK